MRGCPGQRIALSELESHCLTDLFMKGHLVLMTKTTILVVALSLRNVSQYVGTKRC